MLSCLLFPGMASSRNAVLAGTLIAAGALLCFLVAKKAKRRNRVVSLSKSFFCGLGLGGNVLLESVTSTQNAFYSKNLHLCDLASNAGGNYSSKICIWEISWEAFGWHTWSADDSADLQTGWFPLSGDISCIVWRVIKTHPLDQITNRLCTALMCSSIYSSHCHLYCRPWKPSPWML